MDYLSVKDTASRFELSERRVQQLCDAGRIEGAHMISGVWLIPSNAEKPVDDRFSQRDVDSRLVSLSELCTMLSISIATGRNWVRLGKLTPQTKVKKTPFFSLEYVNSVKNSIQKGSNTALKSRRNKKYISGSNIYNSYVSDYSVAQNHVQTILDYIEKNNVIIGDLEIRTLVAECGAQLLLHDTLFAYSGNCLEHYLNGTLVLNGYEFLIDDLISDKEQSLAFIKRHPDLFCITYQYEGNEDVLGLLYISTKNLGARKATGSYYTPTNVVKKLCRKLFEKNTSSNKTILDPCCGTGNFLLQLPSNIRFDNIYGNDIDELSVKIARINLAIKFSINNKKKLYAHITNEDYLDHRFTRTFDYIVGNPPWGYEYSEDDKKRLRKKYVSADGSSIESYDVFIEQAINDLNPKGVLSFVLPEALLNVKTHTPIRRVLIQNCDFQYLDFLGNAFDKVQCPCIIFQIEHTGNPTSCVGMEIDDGERNFQINISREISPECFSFLTTDEEYVLLQKINSLERSCSLANNAVFALGIVTGNNKEYISTSKTDQNEMVLKGSDLCKYRFTDTSNYIVFKPESFQQIAPTEYYRAPEKLLYRFICNQLVFAYDNHQTLSLNSCNIVIPKIEGLSVKYILAILNSRVAQYFFKKTFNSVKVLRSHIEQIPIPLITKEQQEPILRSVETILAARDANQIMETYDILDEQISLLYGLTVKEYSVIKDSMAGENLFLV